MQEGRNILAETTECLCWILLQLKKNGSLSQEAQKYCQLNVEAALLLYTKYYLLPDLTKRMFVSDTLPIGSVVDIKPGLGSCTDAIAQGKVHQVSGRWLSNGFNIINRHVLLQVNKIFNGKGVIHYPCDSTSKKNVHVDVQNMELSITHATSTCIHNLGSHHF